MTRLFGSTRNVVKQRYALLTPSGFVPSYLPGWQKSVCNVLIPPAMGAAFSQLLITLEIEGQCQGNTGLNQYFIYVLEGSASIMLDEKRHRLDGGSYVYLPAGKDVQIKSGGPATRILIFQKEYLPLAGTTRPTALVGHERDVRGQPFLGNDDARLQVLLPDQPAFDMAVDIFTFGTRTNPSVVLTHHIGHWLIVFGGGSTLPLHAD